MAYNMYVGLSCQSAVGPKQISSMRARPRRLSRQTPVVSHPQLHPFVLLWAIPVPVQVQEKRGKITGATVVCVACGIFQPNGTPNADVGRRPGGCPLSTDQGSKSRFNSAIPVFYWLSGYYNGAYGDVDTRGPRTQKGTCHRAPGGRSCLVLSN